MNGFRLGKIFGIDIHVDWSWFVIFVLITWSLAVTFGQIHRDWSFETRWGLTLLASMLFFVSVLVHELAHALAAISVGGTIAFLHAGIIIE